MNAQGTVADSSGAALTAQLEEVWASLAELGRSLSDAEWEAMTPCPGWPVSAQYAHLIGTESMLAGRANPDADPGRPEHVRNQIGGFNEVWVAHLASRPRLEVLDMFDEIVATRLEALRAMGEEEFSAPSWTPIGQADYRRFMQIRVFDCWVHEQDVRDAVGRPGHDSGPAVDQSFDEMVRALGYIVGKKAAAPPESSVRVELTGPAARTVDVAVTAGRASVTDGIAAPTATITMPAAVFARLACGRIPTDAASQVELRGDEALGRRVVENLAFTI